MLLDGARLPPTALTGVVDINQLPDGLIKRVDVVTGGASAAYGSDAMTGVVNFVLDKDFTGFKTNVMAGITDRGENEKYNVTLSGGMPFAAGRGHFLFSGGYSDAAGIRGIPRSWYGGWKVLTNPGYAAGNGQPQFLRLPETGLSTATPGAVVTAGPLRGTEFTQGGAVRQFNFGSVVADPLTSGGDWRISDRARTPDLEAAVKRQTLFTRAGFHLTDDLEVFALASYAHSQTDNQCCWNYFLGNLTIRRDNAFLPDTVRADMSRLGLDTLTVGSIERRSRHHSRLFRAHREALCRRASTVTSTRWVPAGDGMLTRSVASVMFPTMCATRLPPDIARRSIRCAIRAAASCVARRSIILTMAACPTTCSATE